jgi:hypothetical protein
MSEAGTPETDLALIGGETLRVKGSVDEAAFSISRALDSERSGWVAVELADGGFVQVRAAAVGYLRAVTRLA